MTNTEKQSLCMVRQVFAFPVWLISNGIKNSSKIKRWFYSERVKQEESQVRQGSNTGLDWLIYHRWSHTIPPALNWEETCFSG